MFERVSASRDIPSRQVPGITHNESSVHRVLGKGRSPARPQGETDFQVSCLHHWRQGRRAATTGGMCIAVSRASCQLQVGLHQCEKVQAVEEPFFGCMPLEPVVQPRSRQLLQHRCYQARAVTGRTVSARPWISRRIHTLPLLLSTERTASRVSCQL